MIMRQQADFSEFHEDNNERSSILAFTLGRLAFITSLAAKLKAFVRPRPMMTIKAREGDSMEAENERVRCEEQNIPRWR